MNCDHCDQPAIVHEVIIRNGKRHEVHLCEEHARAIGYLPSGGAGGSAPVILGHVMSSLAKPGRKQSVPTCGNCGLTLPQFRQSGLLGCADCYDAFGEPLAAIIEREQAGHCGHVGKRPRRGGGGIDVARLQQHLIKQLDEAVSAEQYERAAKIRDQLLALEQPADAAATPSRRNRDDTPRGPIAAMGRRDGDGDDATAPRKRPDRPSSDDADPEPPALA